MKRFSVPAFALVVLAATTVALQAQVQNVLLEQHTGAWCGWCPDGTVMMDEILKSYGSQVIGVKIHNGDAMAIPEEMAIGGALGLMGFPTASVDRRGFGDAVFLDRGDWKLICQTRMQQPAKAEVDCFYMLNKTTRVVRIEVIANIAEDMGFPLKFNAFVVEDDVTGAGSTYDQKNYLSGRPGFETSPYYTQPSVLVGYHHMKVVRQMLGGTWGVTGGQLPTAGVKAGGRYSYTFVATMNTKWNLDKLWFVGLLQADAPGNKEIINSAVAIQDGVPLNRIVDANVPALASVASGSERVNAYVLENMTNKEQTYTVTLTTTSRTPADWSARFTCGATEFTGSRVARATGQVVVPPGATVPLSLTLKTGATQGIGDAKVALDLQGTPTLKRLRTVSGISPDVQHLLLEAGPQNSLRPYLSGTTCEDAVTLEPSEYVAIADQLPKVNLVIWNKGPWDGISTAEMAAIKSPRKVNHFLCGDVIIPSLELTYFGLQWIGANMEGANTGIISLSGQAGDVITGSIASPFTGYLTYYLINMVKITDPLHVFPIVHFQADGSARIGKTTSFVAAKDTIVGVRSTRNNTKTVLLGITPYMVADQEIRRTLVRNILDWLTQ